MFLSLRSRPSAIGNWHAAVLAATLLAASGVPPARAFSLLGPLTGWETVELGYNIGNLDIGGPQWLGEDYRWNVPVITYAFDPQFFKFFGDRGAAEIDKAMVVLNNLPAVSEMSTDLHEFPVDTRRFNYQAQALNIIDLKSYTLSLMLEKLGLAPAERYVWTLRARHVIGNTPEYLTVQMNYDPMTWHFTPFVNGHLYTYQIYHTYINPDTWEAVKFDVDPTSPSVSSVSALMINNGTMGSLGFFVDLSPGMFFTGLTRDDVGGLRYIYRAANYHVETLATNTTLAAAGSANVGLIGVGTSASNPWGNPFGSLLSSNLTGAAGGAGGGGGVLAATNAAPVDPVLRPGREKLQFVRVDFNSIEGRWIPITNVYDDVYVTNSTLRVQRVQRVMLAPDILFGAADLGVSAGTPVPFMWQRNNAWVNNAALNTQSPVVDGGPGTIAPPSYALFSKLGASYLNIPEGTQLNGVPEAWWGSFDGTTNAPILYPSGLTIQAVEKIVGGGAGGRGSFGSNPWLNPFGNTGGGAAAGVIP